MKDYKVDCTIHFGAIWKALSLDKYTTSAEVGEKVGLSGAMVRKAIAQMRDEGLPIVSSLKRGYKLARTDEEILECVRQLEDRISALQDTVLALKRMMRGVRV